MAQTMNYSLQGMMFYEGTLLSTSPTYSAITHFQYSFSCIIVETLLRGSFFDRNYFEPTKNERIDMHNPSLLVSLAS